MLCVFSAVTFSVTSGSLLLWGLFGSQGEQSLFPEIWPADLCNGDDVYFLGGKTDF